MITWYYFWKTGFTAEECDALIESALDLNSAPGTVGGADATQSIIDTKLRRSNVRWLARTKYGELHARIEDYIRAANTKVFGFDLDRLPELQFTEYNAADTGHYGWHEDTAMCATVGMRKLSCVVQLSDPATYSGGDLQLYEMQPDAIDLKRRGSVIVFPSFAKHRVTNVTRGHRYSLVGWMEGPSFT